MSTHSVNVVSITEVRAHPNADNLDIVPVGGWQAIVHKGSLKPGDKAIYIEPDYVVPTDNPLFSFLARDGKNTHRLKAVKLRGMLSFGLLVPVPDALASMPVGADVSEALGVTRYSPPIKYQTLGDMQELPADEYPRLSTPKFDLENYQRYPHLFTPGEEVVITEKIDGTNARYMWHDGKMFVGSRNRWLKPDSKNLWTRILNGSHSIEQLCREHPNHILYGEIFGPVQALRYDRTEPEFAAFALYNCMNGEYMSDPDFWKYALDFGCNITPGIYAGPFDPEMLATFTEGDSLLAPNHMREGVVIVPMIERRDPEIGRVALKLISNRYWMSKST